MDFDRYRKHLPTVTIFIFTFCIVQIQADYVDDMDNLLALFDKPLLPLSQPKINRYFVVPPNYHDAEDNELFSAAPPKDDHLQTVVVEELSTLPDLEEISSIGKRDHFSLFISRHAEIAAKLIDILLGAKDIRELTSLLCYVHDKINPYLYVYAFSVALMNREDTKMINIPNHVQILPEKYISKEVYYKIREQLETKAPEHWGIIDIPQEYTASFLEVEHRVAYWREDIALNVHHWHWHLTYPTTGNLAYVNKDRRGESFYYMHQQILARYNFERLCNHMNRAKRFSNWNTPIPEAYFPKLDTLVATKVYPSRPKDMVLDDIEIPPENIEIDIAHLIRLRDRIYRSIDLGYVEARNGTRITLNNITGIDILANMVEPTVLSPNVQYYGNLHGSGHLVIAYIHDPKHHHLDSAGVMGYTETAMRDPIFYRWHGFINDIFRSFIETLPPYTVAELDFPNVSVLGVNVTTKGEKYDNVFKTFWDVSLVNLTHGVDFAANSSVCVRYTHLQHRNFTYRIVVQNKNYVTKLGTCRIFMSPVNDERKKPWTRFVDQRHMFIELDRFNVTLKANTTTTIMRQSINSTVTIPFDKTFHDFTRPPPGTEASEIFNYGGCGWPHHLLIPKGTEEGFPVQLFVMITDYEKDKVENSSSNRPGEAYCGIRGSKYPDKRAMGFPFDRLPSRNVRNLMQFLTPNMFTQNCTIKHANEVISS